MFEHKDPDPTIKDGSDAVEIDPEFWPGPPHSNSATFSLPRFSRVHQHIPVIGIADTRTKKQKDKAKRRAKLAKLSRKRNRKK
jgi:hypothetical protein